jgi:hypothetical protein
VSRPLKNSKTIIRIVTASHSSNEIFTRIAGYEGGYIYYSDHRTNKLTQISSIDIRGPAQPAIVSDGIPFQTLKIRSYLLQQLLIKLLTVLLLTLSLRYDMIRISEGPYNRDPKAKNCDRNGNKPFCLANFINYPGVYRLMFPSWNAERFQLISEQIVYQSCREGVNKVRCQDVMRKSNRTNGYSAT